MIDVHYASLTSQGVQHRVFYLDGHPSRYQPRPTGLNFGEQTGTGVFPLVIAVPHKKLAYHSFLHCVRFSCVCYRIKSPFEPWLRVLSFFVRNPTLPRFVNSQLVAFCQFLILLRRYEGVLSYMHGPSSSA